MKSSLDLHEEFVGILHKHLSKKGLADKIADILLIERDAAYRRLSGKVSFSARELGILSDKLNISLDGLLRRNGECVWLPFMLAHPLRARSMDTLFDVIDRNFQRLETIVEKPSEMGSIYTTLPMEFYLSSPVLTKFMFFRWGHYFLGGDEFDDYSRWQLPERAGDLLTRIKGIYKFGKAYYVWDDSLVWTFANEVANLCKMHVIGDDEKDQIKYALKDLLTKLEQILNRTYSPLPGRDLDLSFYISPMHLGFTGTYFLSEEDHLVTFETKFSFCMVEENPDSFRRLRRWIDSFRDISTLLSHSGRVERRIFFDNQHSLIDFVLGNG